MFGFDQDPDLDYSPHSTVGTLTLRGAMTDRRAALCNWINDTVNGKPWKRNVTITELLSVDGGVKPGKAYQYPSSRFASS